jgi:hypothetical protein
MNCRRFSLMPEIERGRLPQSSARLIYHSEYSSNNSPRSSLDAVSFIAYKYQQLKKSLKTTFLHYPKTAGRMKTAKIRYH